ncbi:unnamed protein product [Anisakis simplex]|uniref:Uncharacterized protein n=1 Tax=Anisakis simplex TaxID=6269 RepID=A0A0M3KHM5_ANISI|nr:unnamed protein product [Anisakis simplex]
MFSVIYRIVSESFNLHMASSTLLLLQCVIQKYQKQMNDNGKEPECHILLDLAQDWPFSQISKFRAGPVKLEMRLNEGADGE